MALMIFSKSAFFSMSFVSLIIAQSAPHSFRRQWQFPDSFAGCAIKRVAHCRRNGNDAGFAHAFGAVGPRAIFVLDYYRVKLLRQVGEAGHAIIDQTGIERLTVLIDERLEQCVP